MQDFEASDGVTTTIIDTTITATRIGSPRLPPSDKDSNIAKPKSLEIDEYKLWSVLADNMDLDCPVADTDAA